MMDDSAIYRARNANRGWRIIGVFAAVALLLTGVILIIFFKDDSPPDDARMRPVFTPQRQDNNPLSQFAEYVVQHPPQGEDDLSESAKQRSADATAEMQQYVEKNTLLLARWEELVASDSTTWRWPMKLEEISFTTEIPYLSLCQEIGNRTASMKVDLLLREGKIQDALILTQKIHRFGYGAQQAEGSSIPWLVGIVTQQHSIALLERLLPTNHLDDHQLMEINAQLAPFEPSPAFFRFALQMEYLSFKNTIGNLDSTSREDILKKLDAPYPWLFGFLLRKNRTLNLHQHLSLPLIEASEQTSSELFAASKTFASRMKAYREDVTAHPVHPNAGGRLLLALSLPILDRVTERAVHAIAHHRIAITMIAIRRYELANQKLPERLDKLVPTYLPQVPLDPFDNQPLRWNSATLALYSVSSNLSDEGGLFERSKQYKEPDYGTYYWWSDKAKDQREKEKLQTK